LSSSGWPGLGIILGGECGGPLPLAESWACALGRAEVETASNPGDREDRFSPQAVGDGEFGGIAFQSEGEIRLRPVQAGEFISNDAFGLGFGALEAEFAVAPGIKKTRHMQSLVNFVVRPGVDENRLVPAIFKIKEHAGVLID
jgi:hypothetical protein